MANSSFGLVVKVLDRRRYCIMFFCVTDVLIKLREVTIVHVLVSGHCGPVLPVPVIMCSCVSGLQHKQ